MWEQLIDSADGLEARYRVLAAMTLLLPDDALVELYEPHVEHDDEWALCFQGVEMPEGM